MRQQVQPHFMQAEMQSQQDWIISQHFWSPVVQVTVQPSLVISHLHMHMVKLQQQTIMPFIMQHMPHMPPCSIWQRFCIMAQAVWSLVEQVTFIPPWHFSTLIVQRGTITMLGAIAGAPPVIGVEPMPGMVIAFRSIITAVVMLVTPCTVLRGSSTGRPPPRLAVR